MFIFLLAACGSDYEVVPGPVDVDPGEVTECGFTRVADTDVWAYDCNPVFTSTDEGWAPTVGSTTFNVTDVAGHPFYQLWYTGVPSDEDFGEYGLGYAVSDNGTDWQPHPKNPLLSQPDDDSAWDADNMDAMQIVWDPRVEHYVMVYQGYNISRSMWGLGLVTSPDGVHWVRSGHDPVLDLTAGSGQVLSWCWPLDLELGGSGGYDGYIAGNANANTSHCEVYRLQAANEQNWTGSSERVLAAGREGAWDDEGTLSLAIEQLDDTWIMFYVGFGGWDVFDGYMSTKSQFLGMATSTDGHTWTRDPDPIPLQTTPRGTVGAVAAHRVGDRIHMWVTDEYDGVNGVGLFLYDPNRQEDAP